LKAGAYFRRILSEPIVSSIDYAVDANSITKDLVNEMSERTPMPRVREFFRKDWKT